MPSFLLKALIRNHSQYVSHKVALKSLVLVVHQHQLRTLTVMDSAGGRSRKKALTGREDTVFLKLIGLS